MRTACEDARRRIGAALLAAVAGFGLGSAPAQQTGDGIAWDEQRPLTWDDFQGPVDPEAAPTAAALTAASLSLGYELEVTRGRGCEFEITKIETSAEFHPQHSWVRDRARTEAVLEHEQGHFDLTEIFRSALEREAARLVGQPRRCRAGADMAAIEAEVGELVGQIRESIFAELDSVQRQYDAETGHGTLPDVQRAWTERIREALRRGAW